MLFKNPTTAYEVGFNFGFFFKNARVPKVSEVTTRNMPDEDYCRMVNNHIKIDKREYIRGIKAGITARLKESEQSST